MRLRTGMELANVEAKSLGGDANFRRKFMGADECLKMDMKRGG